jgi:hypothetical protein
VFLEQVRNGVLRRGANSADDKRRHEAEEPGHPHHPVITGRRPEGYGGIGGTLEWIVRATVRVARNVPSNDPNDSNDPSVSISSATAE